MHFLLTVLIAAAPQTPAPADPGLAPAVSGPVAARPYRPLAPARARADTVPVLVDIELGIRLVGRGLTAPLRWTPRQWMAIPAAAVALGAVSLADDRVERLAERNQGAFGDAYFGALEPFGQEYSFPLVAAVYVGGLAFDRPVWRRTAVEAAAASVVAAGIVTPSFKVIFGRVRPREGRGPYVFEPFSGHRSFPSGHTTQAFAIASVFAAESDALAVDVLAYGVAVSVGAARVYHDAHFLTDVLAGAAIGGVVGRAMVRWGGDLTGAEPFIGARNGGLGIGVRAALGPGPRVDPEPRRGTPPAAFGR